MTRRTVVFVDENGKATPSYIELEDDTGETPQQTLDRVVEAVKTRCQWFAMCENLATGVTSHPILGDVPTCDRCKAFAGS